MKNKILQVGWVVTVVFMWSASAHALLIDHMLDLPALNDTTADGNPLTSTQTETDDYFIGGERYVEVNTTVLSSSGTMGTRIQGYYIGDPGNWSTAGTVSFLYGRSAELNISASQSTSVFDFTFGQFEGTPNLSIILNGGDNAITLANMSGATSVAANAAGWSNASFNWGNIDRIELVYDFDDPSTYTTAQVQTVSLTNASVVPEPATALSLLIGGGLLGLIRRFYGRG
jgi:hypothetical protein